MHQQGAPAKEKQSERERRGIGNTLHQAGRVLNFWSRGGAVYLGYKGAQVIS